MNAAKAPVVQTRLKRRNAGTGHSYLLDEQRVIGVTTALNIIDKPALKSWYANMVAERAVDEWDSIAEMGPSARLTYLKKAPWDRVGAAALRGTQIHDLGQQLADGDEVDVPDEHRGPVEAYARWLDKWDVEVIATETPLGSVQHRYGGTADLWGKVGALGGMVCLLDVKTGKGVYDETALQLAAYRYSDLIQPEKGVEIPTPEVEGVFVAHVLPDDVRMLPVVAGEDTFRSFLYALELARRKDRWADWPLIGSAIQPGDEVPA